MTHVLAAEGGYQTFYLHGGEWLILLASVATALLALGVGFFLMRGVLAADEGTEKMKEIAKAIQEGAMAYLKRQFKTIGVILVPLAIIVFAHLHQGEDRRAGPRERQHAHRVDATCSRACSAPARSSSAASCRASPASSA